MELTNFAQNLIFRMNRYLTFLVIFFVGQMFQVMGQTLKTSEQTAKAVADAVKAAKATADSVKAMFDSTQTTKPIASDTLLLITDSLRRDSLISDSLQISLDSIRTDSLLSDSIFVDSLLADSLISDSLITDSLVVDSLLKDSLLADSLLRDSLIADSLARVKKIQQKPDTLILIARHYMNLLEKSIIKRDSINNNLTLQVPDAYFSQILFTPTFYKSVIHQSLAMPDTLLQADDHQLRRIAEANRAMASLYVKYPQLVSQTEDNIRQQGTFRSDINEKIETQGLLAEKVQIQTLLPSVDEDVEVITRRPNFWKFPGSTRIKFNQAYYSENFHTDNSYSGDFQVVLNANYNNQKKINWTNGLVAELGFVTAGKNEKKRVFRPNQNTLRYTTNLSYKVYKNFSVSNNVVLSTHIVPRYDTNSDVVNLDFLSPLNVTIAPGIGYSISWGKKKKFTGNANLAPLAYNIVYVQRNSLIGRHGIHPDYHSKHSFGPNLNINTNMQVSKYVRWNQRFYWYSNLHMTRIQWEHNFDFTISKLITANLKIYPQLDDSNKSYRRENGSYIRFQESFGLGLTYNF